MRTQGTSGQHNAAVLLIVLVSYFMLVLDVSIVITSLPRIRQSLHFSSAGLSWIQNAYTLAFGGLLLLGARAGDILGRRRMFMTGMTLFTVASLAIALAQSAAWLLGARALQGVGAAILAPSTLALLSTHFAEGQPRSRALGLYGATAGVGASVGLVLGGVIADGLSWRVGFLINLPTGLALLFAAHRYIRESERQHGQFDLPGAVSATLGMGALVYGLVSAADSGWHQPETQLALGAGVLLMLFLVWHEARAAQPIMPLRLFASRERAGAYLARMLFLGAMVGFWFFTTQFMQGVFGFSPFTAGLAFLPTTLPNFAAALLQPRLARRHGNDRVLAGGLVLTLAGLFWLSLADTHSSYFGAIALPMVLIGIGQGCTLSPLTVAGIAGVAARDAGAASGLVNAAHQLGGALGLGVLVVVSAAAGDGNSPAMLAQRITAAWAAGSIMLALALLVVLLMIVRPARR